MDIRRLDGKVLMVTGATRGSASLARDARDEELYLVMRGRAMFELDGDRVAAPTGTFIFAPPGVKWTAFAGTRGRPCSGVI